MSRFHSAEHALDYAYRMEAARIDPTSIYDISIKGTNPANLSAQELLADGILIRALALRNLGSMQTKVIDAEYTYDRDDSLYARKQYCIEALATVYIRDKNVDKWLVVDTLKHIMGWKPEHTFDWWGKHLALNKSKIHRMTMGGGDSVKQFYCYWNQRAMDNIRVNFTKEGLIT